MELENVFEGNADYIAINNLLLMLSLLDYWSDILLQSRLLDQLPSILQPLRYLGTYLP